VFLPRAHMRLRTHTVGRSALRTLSTVRVSTVFTKLFQIVQTRLSAVIRHSTQGLSYRAARCGACHFRAKMGCGRYFAGCPLQKSRLSPTARDLRMVLAMSSRRRLFCPRAHRETGPFPAQGPVAGSWATEAIPLWLDSYAGRLMERPGPRAATAGWCTVLEPILSICDATKPWIG